ncbi:MAG: ABC transporter ATP-binding protein [Verrucomicrobiota bacterium]
MENAIEVENLTKVFQTGGLRSEYVVAVDNLSLSVKAGDVYGLIGPNGSGKSTTMKVVLGLMAPTEGEAKVFGLNSGDIRAKQEIGFLPENPYFYKHLTGAETLKFYGKLCGLKGKALKERVKELLTMVGLENAGNRRLSGYSKGMLQRIGLAQAIVQRPKLVVLDEPTAGVDPVGSRQLRDLIMKLKEEGITVFLCSHLLEQVQEVCDEVGIIFEGRMRKEGPLNDLISVEGRHSLTLDNPSSTLISKIENLIEEESECQLLESGKPRTTLERPFINIAQGGKEQ